MALSAVVLNREGVLPLVVTGTTGLAAFHVGHAGLQHARFEWEYPGMAISALVTLQVEVVTEVGLAARGLEGDLARFQPLVTLVAVAAGGKGILAVVACAAGLALGHVIHGGFAHHGLVGEYPGMALFAWVNLGMEGVFESY